MGKTRDTLEDMKRGLDLLRRAALDLGKFPINKLDFDAETYERSVFISTDIEGVAREAKHALEAYFREAAFQRRMGVRYYTTILDPDGELSLDKLVSMHNGMSGPWSDLKYAFAECVRKNAYEQSKKERGFTKSRPKVWFVIGYDPKTNQWSRIESTEAQAS